ncbi:MAG TPA: phytanoyl-CoA dioxygenase family protein [Acidimicrobiales bacterium]|nr:phytanoyl-CoA dioxygenase family protein [Acidimicrobiales bacterium]
MTEATTVDDLPAMDDPIWVEAATIEEFRTKGHACVRSLCRPDEVDAYRPVIHEATLEHAWDQRPLEERDTYGKAFLQATNLWRRAPRIAGFSLAKRFGKVAADLLGVEGVRIYHDQALFKEAGGGATPWHQDQHYWPLDTESTITMWMPLVDVPPEVGSMTFASGSHRLGYLGNYPISDESEAAFRTMIDERGLALETYGAMAAGDTTWHAGWMLHSAAPNPTGNLRAVMTVIYFADGTRVSPEPTEGQQLDLSIWLKGCEPGELAAGHRLPLVWP